MRVQMVGRMARKSLSASCGRKAVMKERAVSLSRQSSTLRKGRLFCSFSRAMSEETKAIGTE